MSAFRSIGIVRHRMATDGDGVVTLAGGAGCPLRCRYCLNPQCRTAVETLSVGELYERVRSDSIYFEATGGGITFGGGEPLLQADFIREFIGFVRDAGHSWSFRAETSLAVSTEALGLLDGLIDGWIVDVKDMNPAIYRAYTGGDAELMLANLRRLSAAPERVTVKLPLIPDFNTPSDVDASEAEVRRLGFTKIVRFTYMTDKTIQKIHAD